MQSIDSLALVPKLQSAPTVEDINLVHNAIKPWIHRTPVLTSTSLSEQTGCTLYCKCQNFQKTGAFKARGAFARALAFTQEEKEKGILTASSGNFASGLALACEVVKAPFGSLVPDTLNKLRRDYLKTKNAEIIFAGTTPKESQACLQKLQSEKERVFISSSSDYNVIAGQATACKELLEEYPDLDIVLTPIGGGGLCAGTCAYVAGLKSSIQVYGVEPERRDVTKRSLESGKLETMENPEKGGVDGTSTNISEQAFGIIRKTLTKALLASDEGIRQAMRLLYQRLKIVVERASAMTVAAILEHKEEFKGKRVGVILTGGNLDLSDFKF